MSQLRSMLPAGLFLSLIVAGCGAAATPSPEPTATSTPAPTAGPTLTPTPPPTAGPSAAVTAETVLPFEDIDVEALAGVLVDRGWFTDRTDLEAGSGNPIIQLASTGSDVIVGIMHDGNGTLLQVSLFDGARFDSNAALFDLGVISGVLMRETLGNEFILWAVDVIEAADPGSAIFESRTFGPDVGTLRIGADPEFPNDGFVYFEPAI